MTTHAIVIREYEKPNNEMGMEIFFIDKDGYPQYLGEKILEEDMSHISYSKNHPNIALDQGEKSINELLEMFPKASYIYFYGEVFGDTWMFCQIDEEGNHTSWTPLKKWLDQFKEDFKNGKI